MDINYLLSRQQIELYRAAGYPTGPVRAAHEKLAAGYRARIDEYRAREAEPALNS